MWQGTSKEEAFKVMTNVCRHLVITHVGGRNLNCVS